MLAQLPSPEAKIHASNFLFYARTFVRLNVNAIANCPYIQTSADAMMTPIPEARMYHLISTDGFDTPESAMKPGPAPQLEWRKIAQLVVDPSYQRDIGRRGALNIKHIAENFEWSKFAPVIVAPIEGGQYAIVDGQHRTTAALLRGFETVPCQIVQADRAQQAAAYAAVNGSVTKTTPQQLFHAKLTSGNPDSIALKQVCEAAGVEVVRRNMIQANMAPGQTQAVGALARCLRDYGAATLITALQCITQTADGNAGFVRAIIIEGYCEVLHDNRPWCEAGGALLRAMDEFCLPDVWDSICGEANGISPRMGRRKIGEMMSAHLVQRLGSTQNRHLKPATLTHRN